jgi:hypothetical protein
MIEPMQPGALLGRLGISSLLVSATVLFGCPGVRSPACASSSDCSDGLACLDGYCVASGGGDLGSGVGDIVSSWERHVDELGSCASASYKVTETQETFTVLSNARYMHVKAWGAGGNGEGQCTPTDDSGLGGYSEGVFKVTGGTSYIIIVGKRGRAGMSGEDRMRFGFGDWGGGGLSGVFRGGAKITSADSSRALIIAGGGGSAGAPGCHLGGTGNHPSAGGQSTMQGGVGADEINGGGGGYVGGSGGAKGEAAKGGTGFVDSSAISSNKLYAQPGSGLPPKTTDKDYDGEAGKGEQSGRVVLHFTCTIPSLE